MKSTIPYVHRDISWLSFNYRVLQEAMDKSVPLFERIKFLAIYSSNLNEFFRVRVANHRNLISAGKKTRKVVDFEPDVVLKQILKIVNNQQEEFSQIFKNEIIPALRIEGINILPRKELNEEQQAFVESYFKNSLIPFVQPMLLDGKKVKPFLSNADLYLAIILEDKGDQEEDLKYAMVTVPSDRFPRFLMLPPSKEFANDLIILDDVVRHNIRSIFPGYNIVQSYSVKLTRDAELYIDDEYSGDLIEKIKKSINKRNLGIASRMVIDRKAPAEAVDYLANVFELEKRDVLREGRYHNNFDFFKFPSLGKKHLKDPSLPPLPYSDLEKAEDFFDEIAQKDHLIHVPYHSYESVIKFFEKAAVDPNVTHIKIIQYRVAKVSRIMEALKLAVRNGKQVFAFIEVKARFDEEANLFWGENLERAGVRVLYSMPGLKVHSKMAIVRRQEDDLAKLYLYFSTGNFHEDTAKLYSDIGVFTSDLRLTKEALRVFTYLETKNLPQKDFEHLLVGQFNLKQKLIEKIDNEISIAKKGGKSSILLKMNSLQDKEMIQKLYEASQVGVDVKLIVRGICSLVPGVKGISDKIHAVSIVDRFLEHARIFVFYNEGKKDVFLSSADWMVRNLHRRVETVFPIYDKKIKKIILDTLQMQLRDNTKARILHFKKENSYVSTSKELAFRSQVETYYYFKRRTEDAVNK